jgi:hypothetical protein
MSLSQKDKIPTLEEKKKKKKTYKFAALEEK